MCWRENTLSQFRHYLNLALYLGWQDVKDTYQRSTLGPLWITLGLGIQVATIGLVFGLIFGIDLAVYFPFLAISLILWTFLVSAINESTTAYVSSQQIVKQMYVPSFFPVLRVLSKNAIIFFHNLAIILLVLIVFRINPGVGVVLFIPGLALVLVVIYAVSTVAGVVSTRYRDFPPIISSVLMVSFYLTPIIWMPSSLPEQFRAIILTFNPFYHLMELVRAPLMGGVASGLNWAAATGLAIGVGLFASWVSKKYSWKIVYWL